MRRGAQVRDARRAGAESEWARLPALPSAPYTAPRPPPGQPWPCTLPCTLHAPARPSQESPRPARHLHQSATPSAGQPVQEPLAECRQCVLGTDGFILAIVLDSYVPALLPQQDLFPYVRATEKTPHCPAHTVCTVLPRHDWHIIVLHIASDHMPHTTHLDMHFINAHEQTYL